MDQAQAQLICNQLGIGTLIAPPERVFGGLLHRMWKLKTDTGTFACKELSKNIDLNPTTRKIYELTEQIAKQFNTLSIPAIAALELHGNHLIEANDNTFLVYPWCNGVTILNNTVSKPHSLKIAALLAKMHLIDLKVPELPDLKLHSYQPQTLISLIERAGKAHLPYAQELKDNENMLIHITQACLLQLPKQHERMVVSHGDLDQKNVLWDSNDNPIIIDWEAARKLDPTQEILEAGLNWCGLHAGHFDKNLFKDFISTYVKSDGHIENTTVYSAFLAIENNLIHWLVHNLENSLNSRSAPQEEQKQYVEQVHISLEAITKIERLIPELISLVKNLSS